MLLIFGMNCTHCYYSYLVEPSPLSLVTGDDVHHCKVGRKASARIIPSFRLSSLTSRNNGRVELHFKPGVAASS